MEKSELSHEKTIKLMVSFFRITKKFNELEKVSIDMGEGEKLFPSELHILDAIGNNYGNSVTELSKSFGITKGAVSQVVNKLFEKGYINKDRKLGYAKEIILTPTEKGWKAFKILDDMHRNIENEFFKNLYTVETEKINSFIEIMDRIEEFIDTFLRHDL